MWSHFLKAVTVHFKMVLIRCETNSPMGLNVNWQVQSDLELKNVSLGNVFCISSIVHVKPNESVFVLLAQSAINLILATIPKILLDVMKSLSSRFKHGNGCNSQNSTRCFDPTFNHRNELNNSIGNGDATN